MARNLRYDFDSDSDSDKPVVCCGTKVVIDNVSISSINVNGGCGCGGSTGGGDAGGDNGGDDDELTPVDPEEEYTCTGSKNLPTQAQAEGGDFTITSAGTVLCNAAPQFWEFDTLTIAPGGYLKIIGTPIIIYANKVVVQTAVGGTSTVSYQIGIFGSSGVPGLAGKVGEAGIIGETGSSTWCDVAVQYPGQTGFVGGTGGQGGIGGTGGTGKPSQSAYFYFGEIIGQVIYVKVRSGKGGKGGTGGTGGKGGQGGTGGSAEYCPSNWICIKNSGNGGTGGTGGVGGDGGVGGNAPNGEPVFFYVKTGQRRKISTTKEVAEPGEGGDRGTGGNGGPGGAPGKKNCKGTSAEGQRGSGGQRGAPGNAGVKGSQAGAPAVVSIIESDNPTEAYSAGLLKNVVITRI